MPNIGHSLELRQHKYTEPISLTLFLTEQLIEIGQIERTWIHYFLRLHEKNKAPGATEPGRVANP